jgi:hypothetical protein
MELHFDDNGDHVEVTKEKNDIEDLVKLQEILDEKEMELDDQQIELFNVRALLIEAQRTKEIAQMAVSDILSEVVRRHDQEPHWQEQLRISEERLTEAADALVAAVAADDHLIKNHQQESASWLVEKKCLETQLSETSRELARNEEQLAQLRSSMGGALQEAMAAEMSSMEDELRQAITLELTTEQALQKRETNALVESLSRELETTKEREAQLKETERREKEIYAATEISWKLELETCRTRLFEAEQLYEHMAERRNPHALAEAVEKAKEEERNDHAQDVAIMEQRWMEERSTLMAQCESILLKTQLAAQKLKRQQDSLRASRDSSRAPSVASSLDASALTFFSRNLG